jgi:hypothetical protein
MSSTTARSTRAPTLAFLGALATVAASTCAFPLVSGYGTLLFQLVVLGGWSLLAAVTSGTFADQHHAVLWPIVVLVNVFVFSLVAGPVYFAMRRRGPQSCALMLAVWLVFYLCSLFFLFPATDGP